MTIAKLISDFFIKTNATEKLFIPVDSEILRQYNLTRSPVPQKTLCYAPFRNIYFGHNGKAVSCCFNRTHVLGVYPVNSIKQIWNGQNAEKLREFITHNDLSLGCQYCNNQMTARTFDVIKSKMYDEAPDRNGYPTVMEFELNNTCNLECIMCSGAFSSSIRSNREKLPAYESPYNSNFVKQLEEYIPYLHEAKFYGGEPFLVKIYYEIWDKIIEINPECSISVQTNGTVLNSRVKDLLLKGNFHFNVSIDSLQKPIYESIRINADFDLVMENFGYLYEYCNNKKISIDISSCIMKKNWFEAPDFINYCNRLNLGVYFHVINFPAEYTLRFCDSAMLKNIHEEYCKCEFPESNPVERKNKSIFNDLVSKIYEWYIDSLKRENLDRKINTIKELKEALTEGLRMHIVNTYNIDEEESKMKLEQSIFKLDTILNKLPEDMHTPEIFKKVIQYAPDINTFITQLESRNEVELYEGADIFFEKLRDR